MDLTTRNYPQARVGLFAIGLAAYWPQFPGLKEKLEGYYRHIADQLSAFADVVAIGLVDTAQDAYAAGARLASEDVDLLICHTATYATSSQVLPIVQQAKVPVLVLNLQPVAALDYPNTDTGEWLSAFLFPRCSYHSPTSVELARFGESTGCVHRPFNIQITSTYARYRFH